MHKNLSSSALVLVPCCCITREINVKQYCQKTGFENCLERSRRVGRNSGKVVSSFCWNISTIYRLRKWQNVHRSRLYIRAKLSEPGISTSGHVCTRKVKACFNNLFFQELFLIWRVIPSFSFSMWNSNSLKCQLSLETIFPHSYLTIFQQ